MKAKDILLVTMQFALLFIFILIPGGIGPPLLITFVDFILVITGAVLLLVSLLKLNTSLSPFPTPRQSGTLITTGPFKYIRHPIYTAILLMALGIGFYAASYFKLMVAGALYFLFFYKSKYEEKMLQVKYPSYKYYMKQTGRFFPKLTFNDRGKNETFSESNK